MKKIMVIFVIMVFASLSAFEYSLTNPVNNNGFSLLNPNKIKMSHSMSFSSAFNSNDSAFYQSTYTNTIDYTFSKKLKFRMNLNFVNNGSAMFNSSFSDFDMQSNNDNKSMILPSFSMEYRPTENTVIHFHFEQADGRYNFFNRGNRW